MSVTFLLRGQGPRETSMPLSTLDILIIALSLIGLIDAAFVYYTQKTGKTLRCLIGNSCDIVTKSRYAKTLGIDNSAAGIVYYAAVIAAIAAPQIGLQVPWLILFAASLAASLFSIYLAYLQFFVIKELCDYCLLSALINWAISALLLTNHL
jgi:uncharacterized membrane protein